LGKVKEELEMLEGQETHKKRDNKDDPGRRRNQRRKIRSLRMDRGR